jgi:thiol-disulfide isomerase/thioredoxin
MPPVGLASKKTVRDLVAGLKGKPYVINIWATWCTPCVEEMPELVTFYATATRQGIGFLSLSVDYSYSVDDTVKPYMQAQRIPFAVQVLDSVPPDVLAGILGVQSTKWSGAVPATFVFDKAGKLVKAWLEEVHASDLESATAPLL